MPPCQIIKTIFVIMRKSDVVSTFMFNFHGDLRIIAYLDVVNHVYAVFLFMFRSCPFRYGHSGMPLAFQAFLHRWA